MSSYSFPEILFFPTISFLPVKDRITIRATSRKMNEIVRATFESIRIWVDDRMTSIRLSRILQYFSKVKVLEIEVEEVASQEIIQIIAQNIHHNVLETVRLFWFASIPCEGIFQGQFPQLKEVDFTNSLSMEKNIQELIDKAETPLLQTLVLEERESLKVSDVAALCKKNPQIKEIYLGGENFTTNLSEIIPTLAKDAREVEYLEVIRPACRSTIPLSFSVFFRLKTLVLKCGKHSIARCTDLPPGIKKVALSCDYRSRLTESMIEEMLIRMLRTTEGSVTILELHHGFTHLSDDTLKKLAPFLPNLKEIVLSTFDHREKFEKLTGEGIQILKCSAPLETIIVRGCPLLERGDIYADKDR